MSNDEPPAPAHPITAPTTLHAFLVSLRYPLLIALVANTTCGAVLYGVNRAFVPRHPHAEATRNLAAIETGSTHAFVYEAPSPNGDGTLTHRFCPSAPSPVPAAVPRGVKVSTVGEWTAPAWKCLSFSINEPQRYSYDYQSDGVGSNATYTATARGDVNDNGVESVFVLRGGGTASGDAQRVSFQATNEDE